MMAEEAPTVVSASTTEGDLSLTPNLKKIGMLTLEEQNALILRATVDGTSLLKKIGMTLEQQNALIRRATEGGIEFLLPKNESIVAVYKSKHDKSQGTLTCTAIGYSVFIDSKKKVDVAVIAEITQEKDGMTTVLEKRQFLSSTKYYNKGSRQHLLRGLPAKLQFAGKDFIKSGLDKINEYFVKNVYIPMVLVAAKLEEIKEDAKVRKQRSRQLKEHFAPYLINYIDLGLKITTTEPLLKLKAFQGLMDLPAFFKGDLNQKERESAWEKAINKKIIEPANKIINNNTNDDDDDRKPVAVPSPTDANNNNNNAAPPSAPPSAQANAAAPPTNDANAQMARLEASMATIIADIEALKIGAAAAAPSTDVNAQMATNAAPSPSTDVASPATTTVFAAAAASSTATIMKSDVCDIADDDDDDNDNDNDNDDDSTKEVTLSRAPTTTSSNSTESPNDKHHGKNFIALSFSLSLLLCCVVFLILSFSQILTFLLFDDGNSRFSFNTTSKTSISTNVSRDNANCRNCNNCHTGRSNCCFSGNGFCYCCIFNIINDSRDNGGTIIEQ